MSTIELHPAARLTGVLGLLALLSQAPVPCARDGDGEEEPTATFHLEDGSSQEIIANHKGDDTCAIANDEESAADVEVHVNGRRKRILRPGKTWRAEIEDGDDVKVVNPDDGDGDASGSWSWVEEDDRLGERGSR